MKFWDTSAIVPLCEHFNFFNLPFDLVRAELEKMRNNRY